jgi:hypothetical protein
MLLGIGKLTNRFSFRHAVRRAQGCPNRIDQSLPHRSIAAFIAVTLYFEIGDVVKSAISQDKIQASSFCSTENKTIIKHYLA